jgi:anthranilate synthase component I
MTGELAAPAPSTVAVYRPAEPRFTRRRHPTEHHAAVNVAKERIRDGEAFQIVVSQHFEPGCDADSLDVYRVLRATNPSPYMYLLRLESADGERFDIVGSSPEALVTVRDGQATTHPIAGTRWRGATEEEDLLLEKELRTDEKERAEHVMLVDLGRNDLGRVCEYGSVTVDELMVVETYSHVMHIVSSVSGTLREGVSSMDALRASLPAGTLSGAPKIRAMQIIDELEPSKRGPYGGAIGYLSYTGDLDTCIFIRSAVARDGRIHVQAGGGIVADSEPGYEVRETEAKADAVFSAVRLACGQGDWA